MKPALIALFACVTGALPGAATGELVDQLGEALSFSTAGGSVRGQISGTVDLEGYALPHPAPALLETSSSRLFSPRLTAYFDGQLGPFVYVFAQARVDRGFDPGDEPLQGRLEEYAVRLTPWHSTRWNLQVGRFATVVGNWVHRHGSWDNPFVTAPLPYENLTGMWDAMPAPSAAVLLNWAHLLPDPTGPDSEEDKYLRLPVLWGPSYVSGVAVSGEWGRTTYAVELKDAALSSRPQVWDQDEFRFRHPTISGRLGWRPNAMWNLGLSASRGSYLRPEAAPTLPPGRGLGDYRQIVFAQDVSFAWHRLQVWAEAFETTFTNPQVGDADVFSYYVEVRYKFTPQFAGALRWNEQWFGKIAYAPAGRVRWGTNHRRLDLGPTYRFSPYAQLKLQYSIQHEDGLPRELSHWLAVQLTTRF